MISMYDVLLATSNIPVDDPIAEIWGRQMQGGYKIIEYTGTLPITINSNGDALLDYRIYGADGRVGVATESGEPAGYKLPMVVHSENLFEIESDMLEESNWELNPDIYYTSYFINYKLSERQVQILKQHPCTCSVFENFSEGYIPGLLVCAICPEATASVREGYRILTNNGGKYTITFNFSSWNNIYLVIGYGNGFDNAATKQLKIDELFTNWLISIVQGSTVPIYIGENQLDAGEYVSYGEQKIYRDVDGTLTPTDPPVSFPEIPTIDGTTVIDYDGDPKPSQMYIKYKGKG